MTRRRRPILLLTALLATAIPRGGASAGCVSPLPVPSDKNVAHISCTGVRPGMVMTIPSKKWGDFQCAAGFAFADQFGNKYLTFPGTCYLDYDCIEDTAYEALPPPLDKLVPRTPTCIVMSESEEEPYYKANGPIVRDGNGARIGRIAWAVNKDNVDFALVRLDKNVKLDPSLPLYGGPVRDGTPSMGQQVYVVSPGNGVEPNARTGVFIGGPQGGGVATSGLMTLSNGSPVMSTDGGAIGILTGLISITGYETQTLGPGIARASDRTRLKLRLVTANLT
jgi:hypothetical protein